MTSRRSFLGVLIGTVAGAPFFGRAATVAGPAPPVDPAVLALASPAQLAKFTSAIRLAGGEVLRGPAFREIVQDGPLRRLFVCEPIEIRTAMEAEATLLLDPEGRVMLESKFAGGRVALQPGDTLNVTHVVNAIPCDAGR